MTYKEANYMIDDITWSYGGKSVTKDDIIECRETCHKAFEKQIPKKPHKIYEKLSVKWCECGYYLGELKNEQNYCKNCGQALDWGDTE